MSSMIKPSWAPDAVATNVGWVNPQTGEILVSVKGLPDAVPYVKGKIEQKPAAKVEKPEPEVTESSEEKPSKKFFKKNK